MSERHITGEKLKEARLSKGLSQEELAHQCGWGTAKQRISNYETGQRRPSVNDLLKLSNALSISIDWLLGQEVPSLTNRIQAKLEECQLENKQNLIANVRAVPIFTWSEIRNDMTSIHTHQDTEYVVTTTDSPNVFAIIIEGDSMESPRGISFFEGMRVIIDPNKEAKPGDFVLAYIEGTNQATFKRLTADSGKLYLKPLNDRYPMVEVSERIKIIGIAIATMYSL